MDVSPPKTAQITPIRPASEANALTKPRIGRFAALRKRRAPWLFMALVVLPTAIGAAYLFGMSSPIFVSEARFVVRSASQQAPSGVGALLQGSALSQGANDSFAVHAYMLSRDAAAGLERALSLRQALARPEADILSRFPRPWEGESFEELFEGYKRFVTVLHDSTTGISTLQVQAFRPEDASRIATFLLDGGEEVINRLNDRAGSDTLAQAEEEVDRAQQRVEAVQTELTAFRNKAGMIDPSRTSFAALDIVARLEQDLAQLQAQRLETQVNAPLSPQLGPLDVRIDSLTRRIAVERTKVAGDDGSLAPKIAQYEALTLKRVFADKALDAAITSRERARIEAQQKKLYLERIVPPNKPDEAILPRRWYTLVGVLLGALALYAMALLLIAGFRERGQGHG